VGEDGPSCPYMNRLQMPVNLHDPDLGVAALAVAPFVLVFGAMTLA